MAIARLARHAKRPYGLWAKVTAVAVMGLCFIFVWSMFSTSSSSVTTQRESFDEIAEPVPANTKVWNSNSKTQSKEKKEPEKQESSSEDQKVKVESDLKLKNDEKRTNESVSESRKKAKKESSSDEKNKNKNSSTKLPNGEAKGNQETESEESEKEEEEEEEGVVVDGKEEATDGDGEIEGNGDFEGEGGLMETVDQEVSENKVDDGNDDSSKSTGKKRKIKGPLFDPKAHYSWRLCNTRSKHNYIPCIDIESGTGRLQSYRHTERSCPRPPPMCLVPFHHDSYGSPVRWPESQMKV